MTRKRRSPPPSSAPVPTRRFPWGRVAFVVGAFLLVIAGLFAVRGRRAPGPASAPGAEGMAPGAIADSARAALKRNDWERAQSLIGRLLQGDPRDPTLLLGEALALHNGAWLQDPSQRRPPCRTSLDRIRAERRALALMDSAAACSDGLEHWVRARDREAQAYQNLGLFTDALEVYRGIEQRYPDYEDAHARSRAVLSRLREGQE